MLPQSRGRVARDPDPQAACLEHLPHRHGRRDDVEQEVWALGVKVVRSQAAGEDVGWEGSSV